MIRNRRPLGEQCSIQFIYTKSLNRESITDQAVVQAEGLIVSSRAVEVAEATDTPGTARLVYFLSLKG
jgi:hypothetical protein